MLTVWNGSIIIRRRRGLVRCRRHVWSNLTLNSAINWAPWYFNKTHQDQPGSKMIKLPGSLPRFLWIWKIHSLKSILRKFQKFLRRTTIWKVLNQDQKVISEKLHFGFCERFRYRMNWYKRLLWEFEKFLKFWSSRYYCYSCSKIRWSHWCVWHTVLQNVGILNLTFLL